MRRPCPTRSAPATSRLTAGKVLVSRVALQLMRVYAKLAILNIFGEPWHGRCVKTAEGVRLGPAGGLRAGVDPERRQRPP